MPATAPDVDILSFASEQQRIVLTQDLDFSRLVATSMSTRPSVISLRLSSSRVEHVNNVLQRVLPTLADMDQRPAIVAIEDHRIRRRDLPVT